MLFPLLIALHSHDVHHFRLTRKSGTVQKTVAAEILILYEYGILNYILYYNYMVYFNVYIYIHIIHIIYLYILYINIYIFIFTSIPGSSTLAFRVAFRGVPLGPTCAARKAAVAAIKAAGNSTEEARAMARAARADRRLISFHYCHYS